MHLCAELYKIGSICSRERDERNDKDVTEMKRIKLKRAALVVHRGRRTRTKIQSTELSARIMKFADYCASGIEVYFAVQLGVRRLLE